MHCQAKPDLRKLNTAAAEFAECKIKIGQDTDSAGNPIDADGQTVLDATDELLSLGG